MFLGVVARVWMSEYTKSKGLVRAGAGVWMSEHKSKGRG